MKERKLKIMLLIAKRVMLYDVTLKTLNSTMPILILMKKIKESLRYFSTNFY